MRKQLASSMQSDYISEWNIFKILDNLRPTAAGLDGLPAWFLRLGAPVFCTQVTISDVQNSIFKIVFYFENTK